MSKSPEVAVIAEVIVGKEKMEIKNLPKFPSDEKTKCHQVPVVNQTKSIYCQPIRSAAVGNL